MGMGRRIKHLIKGYMRTAREKLDDLEAELARRELEESLEPGKSAQQQAPNTRVQEPTYTSRKIELSDSGAAKLSSTENLTTDLINAFRLLGLSPNATHEEARKEFKRLMSRADPARFPEGTEERRRAEQIVQKLQAAYDIIRQHLDPTSARFDRLEIDDAGKQ